MRTYGFKLTGNPTSLLVHQDDVPSSDKLTEARKQLGKRQIKGDDRCPAWTWKTYLYSDGKHIVLPAANLGACLMKGGAEFPVPGKRMQTLKTKVPACLRFVDEYLPICVNGKPITVEQIDAIDNDAPFEEHEKAVAKLGFVIDVRRVTIGQAKHIRCRPKFLPGWTVSGTLMNANEDMIPDDVLHMLLDYCGDYVGLGDWRPSSPKKPGPHGRFKVELIDATKGKRK